MNNLSFRLFLSFLGLFAAFSTLLAQEPLNIKASHYCLYYGDQWPNELYQFDADPAIEKLKDELLENSEQKQNFEFICANVQSVAAIRDGDKRYILYSRRFFNEHQDKAVRMGLLAHAIGHHVNEHNFVLDCTECQLKHFDASAEEHRQADEWAGYALCRAGININQVKAVPSQVPLSNVIPNPSENQKTIDLRISDLMSGFNRAQNGLEASQNLKFYDENLEVVLKNFPRFPIPAPKASASANLNDYFGQCLVMADANKKITKALRACGYDTYRYMYVPDGFAIVTAMEQFNKDGSCKSAATRWSSRIVRCEGFDPWCYLNALITTEPAYFRVFVFVVTPQAITTSAAPPSKDAAQVWLDEGANRLPEAIARLKFKKGTQKADVTALVYEFKIKETTHEKVMSTPSELTGRKHLEKARILSNLY